MDKYRCIKKLMLDTYDDDGRFVEGATVVVDVGEVYEKEDTNYRFVGGKDTIRLSNDKQWMEILPETFEKHFELEGVV